MDSWEPNPSANSSRLPTYFFRLLMKSSELLAGILSNVQDSPLVTSNIGNVVSIAAGRGHSALINDEGELWTAGSAIEYQTGHMATVVLFFLIVSHRIGYTIHQGQSSCTLDWGESRPKSHNDDLERWINFLSWCKSSGKSKSNFD